MKAKCIGIAAALLAVFVIAAPARAYQTVTSDTCGTCHSDYTYGSAWHTNHQAHAQQACATCHGDNQTVFTKSCITCHNVKRCTWVNSHKAKGQQTCVTCHTGCTNSGGPDNTYDVVVIGAGGGGLAAAARLSREGMKVLLIEQNGKVGGYMQGFTRGDYTFDVSLHAFTGENAQLFVDLGINDRYKPVALDPMYRASYTAYPAYDITVPADLHKYKQILNRDFPDQRLNLWKMFQALDDYYSAFNMLINLGAGNYVKALLAWRPGVFLTLGKYGKASVNDFVNDFLTDERLKVVVSQFAVFGGIDPAKQSVFFFSIIWNLFHREGYYYFEGGSASIASALQDVIRENGGEILLYTRASKIKIENEKAVSVQTADGSEYPCRYVISNANVPQTFDQLVGRENVPKEYMDRIDNMTIALSALHVYLGVDKDYSSLFPAGAHGIFVVPSWNQSDAFSTYDNCDVENMPYVIVNYSMVDKTVAPEGKNVICLNSMCAYDWNNAWHTAGIPADAITQATKSSSHECVGCQEQYAQYSVLKKQIADTLIRRAEKFLPDLASHVEVLDVGSPVAMKAFTSNPRGSIFGFENTVSQTMGNSLGQTTPIKNLYLASAWSGGGGQVTVLGAGNKAATMILKSESEGGKK